mmetsp:Transcript_14999/g.26763  ORF Transcript_14999/g.26763 Transcript_14999/m.26763 type:complete len:529 (+) Transcript_14999:601-2187(+)
MEGKVDVGEMVRQAKAIAMRKPEGLNPAEQPGGELERLPEEVHSENLIRERLLHQELPYALNKVHKLLEQLLKEIEPGAHQNPSEESLTPGTEGGSVGGGSSVGGSITSNNDAAAGTHGGAPQVSGGGLGLSSFPKRVASGTRSLQGTSSRLPSPLQFIRRTSLNRSQSKPETPVSVETTGLHMQHKHMTRTQSVPSSLSSSNGPAGSVSSGLRSLTSSGSGHKRGFHIQQGCASSSAAPSVLFSTSSNTWMDVSLNLDGFYIRQATMDIKMHKHHKSVITRSTGSKHTCHSKLAQPQNPWVLEQLKFVHQQVSDQARKLMDFIDLQRERECSPELALEAQCRTHELVVALIESRNILSNPSYNAFPNTLRMSEGMLGSKFDPPLPKEVLVEFAVHLNELVVSAYELHFLSNPKVESDMCESWAPASDYTNKVFRFKDLGKCVEVVDQVQVHFKVHSLQWMLEHLFEAYNIAIRLLRKLEALNRHELVAKFTSLSSPTEADKLRRLTEVVRNHAELPQVRYSNWIGSD